MGTDTKIDNYIAGRSAAPISGAYLDNVEPATGQVYSQVADSDERDVEAAVTAAAAAYPAWSHTPAAERSAILLRLADLIDDNLDELARAESVDNGKPLSVARSVDIPRAAANFRFFATAIVHDQSESHATDYSAINYTLRRPRGVAGLISPWNLPLYLFTWKIAPAIATGNTAVAKPSEVTPMTASLLGPLAAEAGLPDGVLNIVQGLGAKVGNAITGHPQIPTISFTGGTLTGAAVAQSAAAQFKKVSLELGGKNATVIFDDADLDQSLPEIVRSAFANQGQICLCGSRLLVQRGLFDEFRTRFVAAAKELRVGDPLSEDSDQGALVSRPHWEKVCSYVDVARSEGGTVECGGAPPAQLPERCKNGFFLEPTVITGLDPQCRTNQEEIFGPVVTLTPFHDEAEALAIANSTRYGLATSIWTSDLGRAHRVAEQIHAGTVWINCWMLRDLRVPFGGMKHSGVGREGGDEALRFFTEPKNVCVKM
ncbi:MAG: aldehyde dehydrogenase [Planctomycetota bacterium]